MVNVKCRYVEDVQFVADVDKKENTGFDYKEEKEKKKKNIDDSL